MGDQEHPGACDVRLGLGAGCVPHTRPQLWPLLHLAGPALTWEGGKQSAWSPGVPSSTTCSACVTEVAVGQPSTVRGGRRERQTQQDPDTVLWDREQRPPGWVSPASPLLLLLSEHGPVRGSDRCGLRRLDSSFSSCQHRPFPSSLDIGMLQGEPRDNSLLPFSPL